MSHVPDKMIIMGGPVKVAAVVSGTMRILITPTPSADPLFDGVSVQIESFAPNGTTDKVFYPYMKPTTKHVPFEMVDKFNEDREQHESEWMKWAEEHMRTYHPDDKVGMVGESECDWCPRMVPQDAGYYVDEERVCRPCYDAHHRREG